jgi:hypothetical protein
MLISMVAPGIKRHVTGLPQLVKWRLSDMPMSMAAPGIGYSTVSLLAVTHRETWR